MEFLLIAITFPIFYIWGLVSFIKWLSSRSSSKKTFRIKYLEEAISDLTTQADKSPKKAISSLLLEYSKELEILRQAPTIVLPDSQSNQASFSVKKTEDIQVETEKSFKEPLGEALSINKDWGNLFSNWYSDNSINLLLYLGAFLIVASATIYVGFRWETIDGSMKAVIFNLMTLAFFGFGAWFYNIQKIKQAGATFIAIAALLIPFNGLAWYNFVLGPSGVSIGIVWLVTSIVALTSYSLLSYFIRHPFYTYIAGFGGLSISLAFVNTAKLSQEFYILGGIFSSFALLLATKIFRRENKEDLKNFVTPLSVSAHIIMPISLIWGLILAINSGKIFSFEVVLSAILSASYYFVAYSFDKRIGYLYSSLFLIPVSLFLASNWLGLSTIHSILVLQIVPVCYLFAFEMLKQKQDLESKVFLTSAQIIFPVLVGGVIIQIYGNFFIWEIVLSCLVGSVFYALSYLFSKNDFYLSISHFVAALFVIWCGKWLGYSHISIIIALITLSSVYLASTFFLKEKYKKENDITSLSANIIAGLSLLWLVIDAFYENSFYSSGVVVASGLISSYYLLGYWLKKEIPYLLASLLLWPITLFIAGKWFELPSLQSIYLVQILLSFYMGLSFLLFKKNREASESTIVIALSYAAGVFFIGLNLEFEPFHKTIFAALPAIYGLIAVYSTKDSKYLYYNIIFLLISIYMYFNQVLGLSDKPQFLGSFYTVVSIVLYILAINTTKFKGVTHAFLVGSIASIILGQFFTFNHLTYFFAGNIAIAVMIADYSIRFSELRLLYFSNVFVAISLWTLLRKFEIDLSYYPLVFAVLSYSFYFVSRLIPNQFQTLYRYSALVGIGINTAFFGILSQIGYPPYNGFTCDFQCSFVDHEKFALISAYGAAILYGLDSYLTKTKSLGYFASAVGMITFLWQMKYLGFTEIQFYTLPIGIYFLVLSYLQRLENKIENRDLLSYLGLFILFVPTLIQSFGEDGAKYALLLGVEGLVIFALGNSLSYKIYLYGGIAAVVGAVITQTYEFVFSLPRWLITATVGLGLIGAAIFLLLMRKDEHKK